MTLKLVIQGDPESLFYCIFALLTETPYFSLNLTGSICMECQNNFMGYQFLCHHSATWAYAYASA